MSDREKFEGFKDRMIEENEARYGKEVRRKYGDDVVDASNVRVKGMNPEKLHKAEALRVRIDDLLEQAFAVGDPASAAAQEACDLHRQWICTYWPEGMYSPDAHMGLADMYVQDERFRAYYDRIAPGCAEFLHEALAIYCGQER